MSLADNVGLASNGAFQDKVKAAIVHAALTVASETTNEVQTLTVTGAPTGGTFTLASLPGSIVQTMSGTLTLSAATCTGLASTVGLFVGMAVTGTNVPAGTTVATITSTTAITLSANATATGAQSLTFSGTPTAVVQWNSSAADLQVTLAGLANIGSGNVIATGGPLPGTPIVVTFVGSLGGQPQKLITVSANSLTGGSSPTPSFAHTTVGVTVANHAARQNLASRILANPSGYASLMAAGVADNATVLADYPSPTYTLAGGVSQATADNDLQFATNSIFTAYT